MNPALKHLDPIIGIDIHMVQPPGPVPPLPIPHPYVGMILDPADYLPIIGATVFVNGMPRAQGGSSGIPTPPHIPLGGTFVMPPSNESEVYMGSTTVAVEGEALAFSGVPVLSCSDVGMPAPPRPKKGAPKSLFLPTSIAIAIPAGPPVLVGGAPTISLAGLGMAAAPANLGKLAQKGPGKAIKKAQSTKLAKKISDKAHGTATKAMDNVGLRNGDIREAVHNAICTVTGHPVDVASGRMFTEVEDFRVGEVNPFVWERTGCGPWKGLTQQSPVGRMERDHDQASTTALPGWSTSRRVHRIGPP